MLRHVIRTCDDLNGWVPETVSRLESKNVEKKMAVGGGGFAMPLMRYAVCESVTL